VSGIGAVCARPLVFGLPELGTLSRQCLAALVGVALLHCDSGTLRGSRTIAHGRATLDMSTLGAVRSTPMLKALYARLRAAGKAAKVARTACMHKRSRPGSTKGHACGANASSKDTGLGVLRWSRTSTICSACGDYPATNS
jgi:transposase